MCEWLYNMCVVSVLGERPFRKNNEKLGKFFLWGVCVWAGGEAEKEKSRDSNKMLSGVLRELSFFA